MSDPEEPYDEPPPPERALPNGGVLFLLALTLFLAAYLSWIGFLGINPGRFPLPSLLVLAGLLVAIGGTWAYFFVGGRALTSRRDPAQPRGPSDRGVQPGRSRAVGRLPNGGHEPPAEADPRRAPLDLTPALSPTPDVGGSGPIGSRLVSALAEIEAIRMELDALERGLATRHPQPNPASE